MSSLAQKLGFKKSSGLPAKFVRLPDGKVFECEGKVRVHNDADLKYLLRKLGIEEDGEYFFISDYQSESSLLPSCYPRDPSFLNTPGGRLCYLFHLCEQCISKMVSLENPRNLVDVKVINDFVLANRNNLQLTSDDIAATTAITDSNEAVMRLLRVLLAQPELTTQWVRVKDRAGRVFQIGVTCDDLILRQEFDANEAYDLPWDQLGKPEAKKSMVHVTFKGSVDGNSILTSFLPAKKSKNSPFVRRRSSLGSNRTPKAEGDTARNGTAASTVALTEAVDAVVTENGVELCFVLPDSSSAKRLASVMYSSRRFAMGSSASLNSTVACGDQANSGKFGGFNRRFRSTLRKVSQTLSRKHRRSASGGDRKHRDNSQSPAAKPDQILSSEGDQSESRPRSDASSPRKPVPSPRLFEITPDMATENEALPAVSAPPSSSGRYSESNIPSAPPRSSVRASPLAAQQQQQQIKEPVGAVAAGEAEAELDDTEARVLQSLANSGPSNLVCGASINVPSSFSTASTNIAPSPTYSIGLKSSTVSPCSTTSPSTGNFLESPTTAVEIATTSSITQSASATLTVLARGENFSSVTFEQTPETNNWSPGAPYASSVSPNKLLAEPSGVLQPSPTERPEPHIFGTASLDVTGPGVSSRAPASVPPSISPASEVQSMRLETASAETTSVPLRNDTVQQEPVTPRSTPTTNSVPNTTAHPSEVSSALNILVSQMPSNSPKPEPLVSVEVEETLMQVLERSPTATDKPAGDEGREASCPNSVKQSPVLHDPKSALDINPLLEALANEEEHEQMGQQPIQIPASHLAEMIVKSVSKPLTKNAVETKQSSLRVPEVQTSTTIATGAVEISGDLPELVPMPRSPARSEDEVAIEGNAIPVEKNATARSPFPAVAQTEVRNDQLDHPQTGSERIITEKLPNEKTVNSEHLPDSNQAKIENHVTSSVASSIRPPSLGFNHHSAGLPESDILARTPEFPTPYHPLGSTHSGIRAPQVRPPSASIPRPDSSSRPSSESRSSVPHQGHVPPSPRIPNSNSTDSSTSSKLPLQKPSSESSGLISAVSQRSSPPHSPQRPIEPKHSSGLRPPTIKPDAAKQQPNGDHATNECAEPLTNGKSHLTSNGQAGDLDVNNSAVPQSFPPIGIRPPGSSPPPGGFVRPTLVSSGPLAAGARPTVGTSGGATKLPVPTASISGGHSGIQPPSLLHKPSVTK
ncbi:unnamed protein product [Calicophoron daubneyi]|uniref:Uncharacterized protein n=1 Tax=Calicophoron daubneyi TaxID=300641 RepID=A0AAV2T0N9_CALDB